MWIRTQNKQRIINSDQIIDIFIDNTGKKILAETTRDGDFFALGEYENRDICMEILNHLFEASTFPYSYESMPLGGDVDKWLREE